MGEIVISFVIGGTLIISGVFLIVNIIKEEKGKL